MQVTLIYNSVAGDGVEARRRALTDLVRRAGHDVRARSAHDERLAAILDEPADVVAVAGGDGTIAHVAQLMQGRETPIAPLPIGTANNIATALGLSELSFEEQISGWTHAERVLFDVGEACGPWGSRAFMEGFGIGLFPHAMRSPHRHRQPDASMAHARLAVRTALEELPAVDLIASLDGYDCSGRYVAVEAMNIGLIGPNLKLCAHADPGDKRLDVVLVSEEHRDLLRDCLLAEEEGHSWPHELLVLRGSSLSIAPFASGMHIDGEVWPKNGHTWDGAPIEIGFHREGVWFLAARRTLNS